MSGGDPGVGADGGSAAGAESAHRHGIPTERPAVSVVVPFAGDRAGAAAAVALLGGLETAAGDELILADNCGILTGDDAPPTPAASAARVQVIPATGERSPAHARNAGAAVAANPWILFLDADTVAPADLLVRFFADPIDDTVGAVSGEISGYVEVPTLAARFGASRNFLGQAAHLRHPFRPRAASANLLVRREAFSALEGFAEGVRAAEDTDFSWRLQEAGWRLDYRPGAVVGHRYRESLGELRRQWRGYAAGARWLAQRWPGYHPDPALNRIVRILAHRVGIGAGVSARAPGQAPEVRAALSRVERVRFLGVQILLAVEEQIGLRQSNRAR